MPIIDKKNYIQNGSFTYSTDSDQTHHQGFVINHIDGMKTSTNYMVSFKVRVVSGSVNSIGVLKRINHTNGEVFLDNVKLSGFDVHTTIIPPSSSVADTTINNGEFHEVVIKFTTSEYPVLRIDSDITNKGDAFFFNYNQAVECIAEIKDLKWEIQGNSPTTWTRAPEDLVTPYELIDSYTKIETDVLLDSKANVEDVYQKTETYNKSEIEKMIDDVTGNIGGGSGGSIDAYTKAETDDLLSKKVDIESVYLKADTDNLLKSFLPLTGGVLTGDLIFSDIDQHGLYSQAGEYNVSLIKYSSTESKIQVGSQGKPLLFYSSGTPLVKVNGSEEEAISTTSMTKYMIDRVAKKMGSSSIFMDTPNYGSRLSDAVATRARLKEYHVTAEQLNTLMLDTGTYYCGEIAKLNGDVVLPCDTMLIVHTSRSRDYDSVFYSKQTAYGVSPSYEGKKSYRYLTYQYNKLTATFRVTAIKDWCEVTDFDYEITQLKSLSESPNIPVRLYAKKYNVLSGMAVDNTMIMGMPADCIAIRNGDSVQVKCEIYKLGTGGSFTYNVVNSTVLPRCNRSITKLLNFKADDLSKFVPQGDIVVDSNGNTFYEVVIKRCRVVSRSTNYPDVDILVSARLTKSTGMFSDIGIYILTATKDFTLTASSQAFLLLDFSYLVHPDFI